MSDQLQGIGVSPGSAAGPVARMAPPPQIPAGSGPPADPDAEIRAAEAALAAVADDLERRGDRAGGEAAALAAAFEQFRTLLAAAGPYLAERVADLDDIRNRAVAAVLGVPMPGVPDPGHPYVLVAV